MVSRSERKKSKKDQRLRTQQLRELKSRMKREKDLSYQKESNYSKPAWKNTSEGPKSLDRKKTPIPNIPVNLVQQNLP